MPVYKAPDRFVTKQMAHFFIYKTFCARCSLVYLEGQPLKTQVATFMLSDVVILHCGQLQAT